MTDRQLENPMVDGCDYPDRQPHRPAPVERIVCSACVPAECPETDCPNHR